MIQRDEYLKFLIMSKDLSIIKVVSGIRRCGKSTLFEMYIELIRRGQDVYVGQIDQLEVDFVAMNEKGIEYFRVPASVRGEKTLQRSLSKNTPYIR